MDLKITGKRVLVLGSSRGIGKGIAKVLVNEGAVVALCSRNEEHLRAAQRETGAECYIIQDLREPSAGRKVVEMAIGKLGGVDILITNSGGPPNKQFEDTTSEDWQEAFANLWLSTVESIQTALPYMKKRRWGRIILLTSIAAKEVVANLILSNSYRAGLLGLMNTLKKEIAPFNISINSILPGFTRTERLVELGMDLAKLEETIPAGRLGKVEELGELAAFLCSDAASYITGQAIAIDGGYLQGI